VSSQPCHKSGFATRFGPGCISHSSQPASALVNRCAFLSEYGIRFSNHGVVGLGCTAFTVFSIGTRTLAGPPHTVLCSLLASALTESANGTWQWERLHSPPLHPVGHESSSNGTSSEESLPRLHPLSISPAKSPSSARCVDSLLFRTIGCAPSATQGTKKNTSRFVPPC